MKDLGNEMEHIKALQLLHANYVTLNKNLTKKLKMNLTENFKEEGLRG